MKMRWHIQRVPWRYHVTPMLYDEGIRDWRVQWRRVAGALVPLVIEASSIDAARALLPRGSVFQHGEVIETCGAALPYKPGDVMEEWWGEPMPDGAQPRAALPSMPIRTLEGRA